MLHRQTLVQLYRESVPYRGAVGTLVLDGRVGTLGTVRTAVPYRGAVGTLVLDG